MGEDDVIIPRAGIVVPTLGTRPDLLLESLDSIRSSLGESGSPHIVLVCPAEFETSNLLSQKKIDDVVIDLGGGLAKAINLGIESMPEEIPYVNWLGDDDLLLYGKLARACDILDSDPGTSMVFGSCNYIDIKGHFLWLNKSGQWAVPLLKYGPDLVPQPAALFRREAFLKVGGLNPKLKFAFDLDLFIRLSSSGKVKFTDTAIASFRWHTGSLSVGSRMQSILEASRVRRSYLRFGKKIFCFFWEIPSILLAYFAGKLVDTRKSRQGI